MLSQEEIFEMITQRHNKAERFVSLFFMAINCIFFFICLTKFGYDLSNKSSIKNKIFIIFILDFLLRVIIYFTASLEFSIIQEIFSTCISCTQFYIVITGLNQIFLDKNNSNGIIEGNDIKQPEITAVFFFVLTFYIHHSKGLSLLQYICESIAITIYVFYVNGKIRIFIQNLEKKNQNFEGRNYTTIFPLFISLYFFIYFLLKILSLVVEWKLYISYLDMSCIIFKEAGKYLTFTTIMILFYYYHKFIFVEDFNTTNNQVSITTEKDSEKLNQS